MHLDDFLSFVVNAVAVTFMFAWFFILPAVSLMWFLGWMR